MGIPCATARAPVTGLRFEDVIAPLSRAEFLDRFWGKSFRFFPGKPRRFGELLGWDTLNAILERNRLQPPRLRLFRDGSPIEPEMYLSFRGAEKHPVVNAVGLLNILAGGAMLILDQADDLTPSLREIAAGFEQELGIYTSVNVYAGWGTKAGFGLHWDDHETIMLQVSGRKHWKVYRPTREHPLRDDIEKAAPPAAEPVWEGFLEDGDSIYIPRGWWHVAVPAGEPTLHLTFSIAPQNGVDLLRWLTKELRRYPVVRRDVPTRGCSRERKAWLTELRSCLERELAGDAVERFLADIDAQSVARPRLNLPEGVPAASRAIAGESSIRLADARRLSLRKEADGRTLSFEARGKRWKCPDEIAPAMKALRRDLPHSPGELAAMLPDKTAANKLNTFLSVLALSGVIQVESAV